MTDEDVHGGWEHSENTLRTILFLSLCQARGLVREVLQLMLCNWNCP